MGFLGKIFGSGERKPEPRQKRTLTVQQLQAEVEKFSGEAEKELKQKALSKFAEIKHLLLAIGQDVAVVKNTDPDSGHGNPKLRKMAVTAKQNFLVQMRSLIEKLQPPNTADLQEIGDYCKKSSMLMQSEIMKFRKSIALTGFVMREPVKRIGSHIKELSTVLAELSKEFSVNSAFAAASLRAELSQLRGLKQRHGQTAEEIKRLRSKKEALSAEALVAEKRLDEFRNSGESAELAAIKEKLSMIEREKQEISTGLLSKLSPIDKPMHRLLKLANSGNVALGSSEQETLRGYLESPVLAIKQDPKAEGLKKLLALLEQLIKDNTLSLKDRDRDKCINSITALKEFDFFTNIFWKLNDADSRKYALEKRRASLGITGKISDAGSALGQLKRNLAELEQELASRGELLKKTEAETSTCMQAVSSDAGEVLGGEIEVSA